MSEINLTVECEVHFGCGRAGRRELRLGEDPRPACEPGRVPRVTKLLALALKFDALLRRGEVKDAATLARLGQVTRARMTQVMSLALLAPDIIEAVLHLPRTVKGRDSIQLYHLMPIAQTPDWKKQRRQWSGLVRISYPDFM